MTDKALTVKPQQLDVMDLGQVLSQSGYFSDAREASQAIVKVLAGQELGFGPIASMTGIYIVKGRVTLSANLIAAAIKRSERYDYKVKKLDNTVCTIGFLENGQEIGEAGFSIADAKTAKLANGDNWQKYPKNMLFARAMSNGAKWYCPDIFGGPVYTPDELGAEVDGETGEVVTIDEFELLPEPAVPIEDIKKLKPANGNGHGPRPWEPETLKAYMLKRVNELRNTKDASKKQIEAAILSLNSLVSGDDFKRHAVMHYLFGIESGNELTAAQATKLIEWSGCKKTNEYQPDFNSVKEAEAIIEAFEFNQDTEQATFAGEPAPNNYEAE